MPGIRFTATLPIELREQIKLGKVPVPVPPYPNPAIEKLYRKLKKVRGVTWYKKIEGNMITISSTPL